MHVHARTCVWLCRGRGRRRSRRGRGRGGGAEGRGEVLLHAACVAEKKAAGKGLVSRVAGGPLRMCPGACTGDALLPRHHPLSSPPACLLATGMTISSSSSSCRPTRATCRWSWTSRRGRSSASQRSACQWWWVAAERGGGAEGRGGRGGGRGAARRRLSCLRLICGWPADGKHAWPTCTHARPLGPVLPYSPPGTPSTHTLPRTFALLVQCQPPASGHLHLPVATAPNQWQHYMLCDANEFYHFM